MQRLNRERGAVGVMAALLIVPLIGFAAISIDVAAMWAERQQLQSGSDAAALAIAAECARSTCGTTATTAQRTTAQQYTTANTSDQAALADQVNLATPNRVTVANSGVHQHWFAPVLGFKSGAITSQATSGWGAPTGGTAVLPLAFSYCEFSQQTGGVASTTEHVIFFTKDSSAVGCTGPSNNAVPGGFAWLDPDSGGCNETSATSQTLWSSTGASVPTGCTPADMTAVQNKVVLLPLFDQAGDSGTAAWYRLYGYAAFKVTGYNFPSKAYTWNASGCLSPSVNCLKGYFTTYVGISDAFDYGAGAPNVGATLVSLMS